MLILVEKNEIAKMILDDCKTTKDELSNDLKYIGGDLYSKTNIWNINQLFGVGIAKNLQVCAVLESICRKQKDECSLKIKRMMET